MGRCSAACRTSVTRWGTRDSSKPPVKIVLGLNQCSQFRGTAGSARAGKKGNILFGHGSGDIWLLSLAAAIAFLFAARRFLARLVAAAFLGAAALLAEWSS